MRLVSPYKSVSFCSSSICGFAVLSYKIRGLIIVPCLHSKWSNSLPPWPSPFPLFHLLQLASTLRPRQLDVSNIALTCETLLTNVVDYFGTATDNNELSDTAYRAELNNAADWGQLTPANSMKWGPTEPQQNTFTYSQGDQIVTTAQANGQVVRCHNLVWYNQLPSWVTGSLSNATMMAAVSK